MRGEVMDILAAAARKLRRVRAAEAAAVGAVAAGLSAAALESGWAVARVHPFWAAACCLLPIAAGAVLLRSRRVRSVLGISIAAARTAAALCGAAGSIGAVCVLAGWHEAVPKALLPLVLWPVGAAAGAAGVLLRPITPLQAAVFHDLRLGLDERLGTAAELAAGAPGSGPFAECVFSQALLALQRAQPQRRPVWRRTRATVGAIGLSGVLCLVVALLPTMGVGGVAGAFQRIRDEVPQVTGRRRADLVKTLRRLAEQARGNPKLLAALRAAAAAAQRGMTRKTQKSLDEARRALAGADEAEALRIAHELLAAMGLPVGEGPGGAGGPGTRPVVADGNGPSLPDGNSTAYVGEKPLTDRVLVYVPEYADVGDANAATSSPGRAVGGRLVPLDDAWTAARARAERSVSTGRVPSRYRRLVRRFFEIE